MSLIDRFANALLSLVSLLDMAALLAWLNWWFTYW